MAKCPMAKNPRTGIQHTRLRSSGLQNNMVAEQRLSKLKKFSGLIQHNKLKKLYKATILPALVYQTVPLNSQPLPAKQRLKIVQNKALRFVTNAERYTINRTLHSTCNIDPINITLHKQAKHTLEKINYNSHTPTRTSSKTHRTQRFLSSRLEAARDPLIQFYLSYNLILISFAHYIAFFSSSNFTSH